MLGYPPHQAAVSKAKGGDAAKRKARDVLRGTGEKGGAVGGAERAWPDHPHAGEGLHRDAERAWPDLPRAGEGLHRDRHLARGGRGTAHGPVLSKEALPSATFLGRLDSWANSRNKVYTYKVGDNVLGCVRVHVCVARRRSGMWGEEWCGAHGVCGESGQGVRVERGGAWWPGGLLFQSLVCVVGGRRVGERGAKNTTLKRNECHRKGSDVIKCRALRVSIKRGVSVLGPTCAGQWRGVISSLSCVSLRLLSSELLSPFCHNSVTDSVTILFCEIGFRYRRAQLREEHTVNYRRGHV